MDLVVAIAVPGRTAPLTIEPDGAYELHADSFRTTNYSLRRQEAVSAGVDGEFLVSMSKGNVTEDLVVWVRADTGAGLVDLVEDLKDCLSSRVFYVTRNWSEHTDQWTCFSATQLVVERGREFIHANRAVVRAQIPRLPS